jgi:thymidylate synthase ThyX
MNNGIVKRYNNFSAEIMADSFVKVPKSLNTDGYHRITTIRTRFPRIVLAEENTHRLKSRNSASSRAIPAEKMRGFIKNDPFVPDKFPMEHKGMQASDWVEQDNERYPELLEAWLKARDQVLEISETLSALGISKQLTNRFLEPVGMHTVISTSTEWENYFALRVNEAAQNEIRIIADLSLQAMNESQPNELQGGGWHVPYSDNLDEAKLQNCLMELNSDTIQTMQQLRHAITVARCARTSYMNYEGKDDFLADLKLFEALEQMGHWSPFEHVAQAMTAHEYENYFQQMGEGREYGWCANFRGFIQLRRMYPRAIENRTDSRLLKLQIF